MPETSPKPLVVIPVCSYDVDNCLKNLELCSRFNPVVNDYEALLHSPQGFDTTGVLAAARKVFKKVHVSTYPELDGDKTWPRAANWAWQEAARTVSLHYKKPWLWWVQDAEPLVANWLDTLAKEYASGKQPFGGHIVKTEYHHYMNGVGFYPPTVARFAPMAMRVTKYPFDIVAGQQDNVVGIVHPMNHLMGHEYAHRSVSFQDRAEVDALIAKGLVIFHHCKDGSLYAILTGRPVPRRVLSPDVPSFLEQTDWPTGLFTFPSDERTVYFNPALLKKDDTFYLFTRRYRYPNGSGKLPMTNDLAIWRLTKHLAPVELIVPEPPNRYPKEQWEDPRVIDHGGAIHVAFATWVHMRGWTIRQSLCKLSADWRRFTVAQEPLYGGNAPTPERATRHEKNWLWFIHEGQWHCVYMSNPFTVLKIGPNGHVSKAWKGPQLPLPWSHGEPRGGTTPIRVGQEYVTFFHSSLPWTTQQRRYYMGALTFEAAPPFAIKRITLEPLLAGSDKDARVLGGPLVIFPCGSDLSAREWLVTFGVNDEQCGWVKIPQGELDKLLVPINRPQTLMEKAKAMLA